MTTYIRKLSKSGSASANQTFTVPKDVSRQWQNPEYVAVVFDGERLIITPHELNLKE